MHICHVLYTFVMSLAIDKPTGLNYGGIAKVQYCPVALVNSIEEGDTPVVNFKEGGEWFPIYLTPESMAASCDQVPNDGEPMYKAEVTGRTPGDGLVNGFRYQRLAQYKRFILRVVDQNKMVRLYGNMENPMEVQVDFSTGAKTRDLRHRQVTFKGILPDFPPIYV